MDMKNKIALLILISCIYGKISYGQTGLNNNKIQLQILADKGILSGKINDALSGAPLPGANIFIHDIKVGAVAGEGGNYKEL